MKKNPCCKKLFFIFAVFCLLLVSIPVFAENTKTLMMATTTSTENTGLLDVLKPAFEKATGIELKWTATGTGKALKLGENCDVDVLMVHAPSAEKKFVENGFGVDRREFMYNDFVIIGPESDPAGTKGKTVVDALKAISEKKMAFVSRGDKSGTHEMELSLWKSTGLPIPEKETWYIQSGQGMLPTITMAEEKNGYTLTDRGTYIKYEADNKENPALKILVEGDKTLFNQYSVIAVNPQLCPKVKYEAAMKWIAWVTGKEAQQIIKDFKLLGKPLFTPNAK
ncbi:MAG: tungsten ABC transporter substrate-binding protein [Desulfobacteraceae bacterium]|nr:tungsten ABC transporter substrate-binding protein [Desulfobacteraceae bacterium]MBU4002519.1 substrate-binding domain-containing protein [Pseudomonadota bacterium]MBU4054731.1 substrate-binding domain-containing protein [Pseudomonadota bacterium]